MFTYDDEDELIDPMLEGYDSDIAAENRKRIRRNFERRSNVLRKAQLEDDLAAPYTEKDVYASLHVALPNKRKRSIYDNVEHYSSKERKRIESITQQLKAREDFFAQNRAYIETARQARMLRELEEYGLKQNEMYQKRADARKARLQKAQRLKNEYTLRNHLLMY